MNKAKELFDRYVTGGAAFIEQIAISSIPETLHLDFKEWTPNFNTRNELSFYARSLSAFSNSDGGILVWGVRCKSPGSNEPDVTQSATPIDSLASFLNLLEGRTDDLLQPGINGIVHRPLKLNPDDDRGYAVTYIPRAEGPPQMALGKDVRGFYCRVGSRTLPMEHYQIADRFRARPQPRLEVFLRGGHIEGASTRIANRLVDVCVRNVGVGLATHVAVSLNSVVALDGHSRVIRKLNIIPTGGDNLWKTFALPLEEPLYPGSFTKLAYFMWSFPTHPEVGPKFAEVIIDYRAFCDGHMAEGSLNPEMSLE